MIFQYFNKNYLIYFFPYIVLLFIFILNKYVNYFSNYKLLKINIYYNIDN